MSMTKWDKNDDSSPTEYSKRLLTELLVTVLVKESDLYYILQATSSLSSQGITSEEIKVFNVLIL